MHANLARHAIVPPATDERLACVVRTRDAVAPHLVEAPCHLDHDPNNLLTDGPRLWLIDWELACQSDPFHDLATLAIYALPRHTLRSALVRAYLGREPTGLENARLELARTLALAFYGAGLLNVALACGLPLTFESGDVLELDALNARTEGPALTAGDDPVELARVLLHEARRHIAGPEHEAALAALR